MSRGELTVIRFNGLTDPTGRYYLDDPAPDIRDLLGGDTPGCWLGKGAAALGLVNGVTDSDLGRVLEGRLSGASLLADPRRRRTGFDLIMAAPKSVSVLLAHDDREIAQTVVRGHQWATEVAMGYFEQRAVGVARWSGPHEPREVRPVDGVIAAGFTHGISRSGDPHLHTHVVVANIGRDTDGRFGALDQRGMRAHLPTTDALYRGALRWRLREDLGVRWQRSADGGERIEEVTDAALLALSGRSAEIRSGVRERPVKRIVTRSEALAIWRERLDRKPLIETAPRTDFPQHLIDEHRFAGMVLQDAVTPRRLVQAWCESAGGGIDPRVPASAMSLLAGELGHGVIESTFAQRDVSASPTSIRLLGPRPTALDPLKRWWSAQRSLHNRQLRASGQTVRNPGDFRRFGFEEVGR